MQETKFDRVREFLADRLGPRFGPRVASLLWPVYLVGRFLKTILRKLLLLCYEGRIALFLATKLPWVFYPAYRLLAACSICFVVNMSDGTGHIIPELDNFLRLLYLSKVDRNKRYVWVRKSTSLSRACVDLYGHKFWWAISNDFIYALLLPITIRYKDITLDTGLSRMKWQLTDNNEYYPTMPGQSYLHRISKSEGLTQWRDWYRWRSECPNYFPLKEGISASSQLMDFLNGNIEKLALIHIRTNVMNATAKPTDPGTYLDTLAYLVELGYQLVFVGRERMPEAFRRFQVINYSGSNIASFKNDIQVFNLADIAITAGSGISYLADCYGKACLYLNSWHLFMPPFSRYCVYVPALVQNPRGDLLKFSEQFRLYNSLVDVGPERFPEAKYRARNATPDEILAGAQEMMLLKENYRKRRALQEQFRQLDNNGWIRYSEARCSEYFLKKHRDLF